ncbi:hypothetical protein MTO96_043874, partial [Rhipicephalus appendiculatus]
MVFLSLLVICFFSKSLAFETKTSTGDKKHYIPELKPNLTVLVEALNTTERIWLKMMSYPKEYVTCLYIKKVRLTNDAYDFDEWYLKMEQKKKVPYSAKLSESPDGPVMHVKHSGSKGGRPTPYVLKFWDKHETCGIFKLP